MLMMQCGIEVGNRRNAAHGKKKETEKKKEQEIWSGHERVKQQSNHHHQSRFQCKNLAKNSRHRQRG